MATTHRQTRCGRVFFGLRPRQRRLPASRCARRSRSLSGHAAHSGRERTHTRRAEIHDGLRVVRRRARAGVHSLGAAPQRRARTSRLAGKAFDAEVAREHTLHVAVENRMSLRPCDSARIAPAVERPMPGSACTASIVVGKLPAVLPRRSAARRDADCARARSSRAPSTDAALRRPAQPPSVARRESAA